MAYVYVRNDDSVVIGVHAEQITLPAGVTEYSEDWVLDNLWSRLKLVRNEDGTYTNTGVAHPDDNDGLI